MPSGTFGKEPALYKSATRVAYATSWGVQAPTRMSRPGGGRGACGRGQASGGGGGGGAP